MEEPEGIELCGTEEGLKEKDGVMERRDGPAGGDNEDREGEWASV